MNPQALDKISSSKETKAIGFTDLIDLHLLLTSEAHVALQATSRTDGGPKKEISY